MDPLRHPNDPRVAERRRRDRDYQAKSRALAKRVKAHERQQRVEARALLEAQLPDYENLPLGAR